MVILAFILGCQSKESQQAVVARVGSYVITQDEFDEAYKNSAYGREHNLFYRSAFLKNMINQKLILLDAERRGLDRDPQFLKDDREFLPAILADNCPSGKNQGRRQSGCMGRLFKAKIPRLKLTRSISNEPKTP